jgi:transposase InsO family protein
VCARVGNQRSRGVVIARVRTDVVQSLRHQCRDLHQSTYPVPLERSGLILLSKAIHSDNGTEFRNASFDMFCLEHGIDQQFFAPSVPQ